MSETASRRRWTRSAGAAAAVAALVTAGTLAYAAATDAERVGAAETAVEQDADPPAAGPRVHGGPDGDAGAAQGAGPAEGAGPPGWARARGGDVQPVPCEQARNHGQYVSSIARTTPPGPGKGAVVSAAAEADCPPGFRDRPED